jgi:hypothetical protein
VGVSKRRRLGWAIALALTSGSAAWAAGPAAAGVYKLECPRILTEGVGPPRHKGGVLGAELKESVGDPDLRLGGEPFYSLEQQVAYFVAHEPSLVVRLPESFGRPGSSRIELATLEVHLPF